MTEPDPPSPHRTEPAPQQPSSQIPVGRLAVGVALVLIGVGALLEAADWASFPWEIVLPSLLIFVGVAMILAARAGRHRGLFVFGVILTLLLATGTTFRVAIGGGVGDRTVTVTSVEQLDERYDLGVGNLVLDLRDLEPPSGLTMVRARVGVGELVVLLPSGGEVFVDGQASVGSVTLPDGSNEGIDASRTYRSSGYETALAALRLELRVGIGSIEVRP